VEYLEHSKENNVPEGIGDGDYVYYVHSYYVKPEDDAYGALAAATGLTYPQLS
jgi:imidazoleglycerol phosphate synthase glutamine amidotransferase subunit HisH